MLFQLQERFMLYKSESLNNLIKESNRMKEFIKSIDEQYKIRQCENNKLI